MDPDLLEELLGSVPRRADGLDGSRLGTQLEKELAAHLGSRHAVVVSSGTAAIHCALVALGIGEGDEVLVPAVSVVMTVAPVLYQRATPVFLDSTSDSLELDYDDLEAKSTARTKAIIPVHLWGYCCDIEHLTAFAREHRLWVVEDACQAHGSLWDGQPLGTLGDLGCFSLRQGKLMSTGEGGFLLTEDADLADACRAIRDHWAAPDSPGGRFAKLGFNYRLSELQALAGIHALRGLRAEVERRRWQASYLRDRCQPIPGLLPLQFPSQLTPNCFCPTFLLPACGECNGIAHELARYGVANSVGTFDLVPADKRPILRGVHGDPHGLSRRSSRGECDNAQRFLSRVLALMLHRQQDEMELDRIAISIKGVIDRKVGHPGVVREEMG